MADVGLPCLDLQNSSGSIVNQVSWLKISEPGGFREPDAEFGALEGFLE